MLLLHEAAGWFFAQKAHKRDSPYRENLEGQIVGGTFTCGFLCWRERRGGTVSRREWACLRSTRRSSSCRLGDLTTDDIIGTNIVEPAAVVLMGVDIELYGQILALLDIELLDTIFTEDTEEALAGILARDFNDIILRHPVVACA